MQDEARHVAFGRLALRDYYRDLSAAERSDREDFVIESCHLLRDRLCMTEVWENLGLDVNECREYYDKGPRIRAFRSLLFTRIVPCIRDIGLWGPRVQQAYADMGILEMAGADLVSLMESDERQAEQVDAEKGVWATEVAEISGAAGEAAGI
jgi:hypothetical protein